GEGVKAFTGRLDGEVVDDEADLSDAQREAAGRALLPELDREVGRLPRSAVGRTHGPGAAGPADLGADAEELEVRVVAGGPIAPDGGVALDHVDGPDLGGQRPHHPRVLGVDRVALEEALLL